MEKNTKILLIVCFILVAVLSLTIGLLIANQSKPTITLNSTNNTTPTQANVTQKPVRSSNSSSSNGITAQQAIKIAKGTLQDSSQTHAYATYSDTGAFPYYEVNIIDDNTKHSTYGQKIFTVTINAQTGEVLNVT